MQRRESIELETIVPNTSEEMPETTITDLPRNVKFEIMLKLLEILKINNTYNLAELSSLALTNKYFLKTYQDFKKYYGSCLPVKQYINEIQTFTKEFLEQEKDQNVIRYLKEFDFLIKYSEENNDTHISAGELLSDLKKMRTYLETFGLNIESFYDICKEILSAKYHDQAHKINADPEYFLKYVLTKITKKEEIERTNSIKGQEKNEIIFLTEFENKKVNIHIDTIKKANHYRREIKAQTLHLSNYAEHHPALFYTDSPLYNNIRYNYLITLEDKIQRLHSVINHEPVSLNTKIKLMKPNACMSPSTAFGFATSFGIISFGIGSMFYGLATHLSCNYKTTINYMGPKHTVDYHINRCVIISTENVRYNASLTDDEISTVFWDVNNAIRSQKSGFVFYAISLALGLITSAIAVGMCLRRKKLNAFFKDPTDELNIENINEHSPLLANQKKSRYSTLGIFNKSELKEVVVEKPNMGVEEPQEKNQSRCQIF